MVLETNQAVRVSEMKRSIGQIPSWHATSNARVKSGKSHVTPGPKDLLLPVILEANHQSGGQFLEPCAVPVEGATVRIVAYDEMIEGQEVELIWKGQGNYNAYLTVGEAGRYLDFIVPQRIVLDNIAPGTIGYCDVSYRVTRGEDEFEHSPVRRIGILDLTAANPAPHVPQAPNGEFNPNDIPEPGLKIEYPRPVRWGAFWISYGRDGRVIASVGFNVAMDETFVYMWRLMLEQTESGGEVRTNYYTFNNDNVLCQSLDAVLRVAG